MSTFRGGGVTYERPSAGPRMLPWRREEIGWSWTVMAMHTPRRRTGGSVANALTFIQSAGMGSALQSADGCTLP
ncbi:hypothetical protein FOMPIDRAFT_1026433 [Fomitopsis schrenkii]|uniref:Uncharacterized protein n=1 Tax=Fomitopsis schrenkii TaxID=2126942 RepID=S8DJM6_FOMSC|nr:hypothetical protein FOMPIDRAFT_1026433 [Fomitopsis schrenkii]